MEPSERRTAPSAWLLADTWTESLPKARLTLPFLCLSEGILIVCSTFSFHKHPLQTFPFFGVVPAILDESGEELEGEAEGYLVKNS